MDKIGDATMAAKIEIECGKEEGDIEMQHVHADKIIVDLLRALGYVKTADAWEAVPKWYA